MVRLFIYASLLLMARAAVAEPPPPEAVLKCKVQPFVLAKTFGTEAVSIEPGFDLATTRRIWREFGIAITFLEPIQIDSSKHHTLSAAKRSDLLQGQEPEIEEAIEGVPEDCILVFFVKSQPKVGCCDLYTGRALVRGRRIVLSHNDPTRPIPTLGGVILAHEIGHNLDLDHFPFAANLMNTFVTTQSTQLEISQLEKARTALIELELGTIAEPEEIEPLPLTLEMRPHNTGVLRLHASRLIPGKSYVIERSENNRFWLQLHLFKPTSLIYHFGVTPVATKGTYFRLRER